MNLKQDVEFSKENKTKEEKIPIHGFEQILAMLKVADSEFRESLLRRLAAKDAALANRLKLHLKL
ncbi:MAG: hypothetical protein HY072_01120 [Deltaproteobacteria bacterium]|nr:hypothetical protein [Deltaproteobacteria bacterium]